MLRRTHRMKEKTPFKTITIILIILSTILFNACTLYTEEPSTDIEEEQDSTEGRQEEGQEEKHTPIEGGTLFYSILAPSHFNPILYQGEENYHLMKLIYQSLVSLDENYRVKALLAEDWTTSNKGKSIIFNLREDVRWHDGEAFTAEDVVFTLDALKSRHLESPYAGYTDNITDYKMIDDFKVEISFEDGKSGNLEAFIFPILPAHSFKSSRDVMTENQWSPMGTGPYKFTSYQAGKDMILNLNENYWDKSPYIKNIHVKIRNKQEDIVKSFENKDSDLLITAEGEWSHFGEDQSLKTNPYITQKFNFIALNHKDKIFQDIHIRKAIQSAINRPEMLNKLYLNQGEVADMPISPKSWLYNNQLKDNNYNISQAKEYLAQSEWQEEDVLEFTLMVNKEKDLRIKEGKSIKDYLKAIDIIVHIEEISAEEIQRNIDKKKFEAILMGWDLSYLPDLTFVFHSNEIRKGMNFISYNNQETDQFLEEASKYSEEKEKKEKYSALQSQIVNDLPYINLYFTGATLISNSRIKGPIQPMDYNLFNNIEEWYIEYE